MRIRFALSVTAIFWCGVLQAQDAEKTTFKGKVVDINNRPVPGALVRLYEIKYDAIDTSKPLKVMAEQNTTDDGSFGVTLRTTMARRGRLLIVEKEGLALGWNLWVSQENKEATITLGEPNEFAGTITDANGQSVTDAEVGIFALTWSGAEKGSYLSSTFGAKFLTVETNEAGKFALKKIPSGAKAEFIVKKAGKATITTFQNQNYDQLKYTTGQTDIKIVMQGEAIIEGRVVEKETKKGVAGVRIIPESGSNVLFGMSKPIESDKDGAFRIDGLPAGKVTLTVSRLKDKPQEWVAQPVEVTTEEGKTVSGVEVVVSKGALLEIVVTEAGSKKPVSEAYVNIRGSDTGQYFNTQSDSNGKAQIWLSPGEYEIFSVYNKDYAQQPLQQTVTVEADKTAKIAIELNPMLKITGIVRDGLGKPVEGAECRIYPRMNDNIAKTDANGRFETSFNRQSWGNQDMTFYMVVLAKKENLAWTGPLEEEVNKIDIKLAPAIVYTGKVIDSNGSAIEGAKVTLMGRFGNYGEWLGDEKITTDKRGRFEIKCVPEGLNSSVSAQADGYSKEYKQAESDDAENGRLDLGEFQLIEAAMSVTGIVVDVNDVPVAGARLYCYGQKQAERSNITADANGRFTIDKVCEGNMQINAHTQREPFLQGFIQTEGGATDVKIVVSQQGYYGRSAPKKAPSITGKPIPEMNNLDIKPAVEGVNDKALLICFFDVQQRPSRHLLKELAGRAAGLKEKGITIVGVQAAPIDRAELDEQLKKEDVMFASGMTGANEEKVKNQWGVNGLPWLILTDKQHIVKASGFEIAEINSKLEGLEK